MAMFRVYRYIVDKAFAVLLISSDRHIRRRYRHTEPGTRYQIIGVLCNKGGTVKTGHVRNFQYLDRFKGSEVDTGNPRRVVAVDKQPPTIKLPVLLGKLNMVGVVPGHKSIGGVQNRLGFFVIAISVFGKLGKNRDFLKQP